MRLSVRSAVPEDEARITELWRECDLVVPSNDPAADFQFAKAGCCSDVLVGEDGNGRLRGSVMVGHDGHRGWLYYVAIDPSSRGAGYGRRMVEAGEAWLHARGVAKVQLLVRETNANVVAFYEHLGFEVMPRTVMAKWLVESQVCGPGMRSNGSSLEGGEAIFSEQIRRGLPTKSTVNQTESSNPRVTGFGMDFGPSEAETFWTAFLRKLARCGRAG